MQNMKGGLRVVFLGTPDFAVESLKLIHESKHQVVGVVTVADKKGGRGNKIIKSAIKRFAEKKLNIPILQPIKLKDEKFLSELKSLNADVFVIVAFRMLPKVVWDMPKHGTFNLHASLLPKYRGAAPINWALINDEQISGVTTFFIDEKIDTGEIIDNVEVRINENMIATELHDILMVKGSHLVVNTLNSIEQGNIKTKPQNIEIEYKEAPKLYTSNTKIDLNLPKLAIHNFIRGLSYYPGAWLDVKINNKQIRVKILRSKITEINIKNRFFFEQNKKLHLSLNNGDVLEVLELQIQGKKICDFRSILNGYKVSEWLKI